MRVLRWTAIFVAVVLFAAVLFLFFGLNTLKGPITRAVQKSTGRELLIEGDIRPSWSLVHPRFRIGRVSLSNAKWAKEKYLFTAESVDATISVMPLIAGRVEVPELHLQKPVVNLELDAEGRKNWVLEENPRPDKPSRVHIQRLTLDQGRLAYDDAARDIHVVSDLASDATGIGFRVDGKYGGQPFAGLGHGGPVLALRDVDDPYPLTAQAKIGNTSAAVDGKITRLAGLEGIDMKVELSGRTMEDLYDVLGVAFPHTSAYSTSGHLVRKGKLVRYENFTGKVGSSDIAGTLEFDTSGDRPVMRGDLASKVLDLADLGPLVGTQQPKKSGVLPDAPFDAKRWRSVDADVKIRAGTIRRPEQIPLDNLDTRIVMRDAVLTLDPLKFGVAGGELAGPIRLDGRNPPIKADAKIRVQKLQLAKLFPTVKMTRAAVGDLNGAIELSGTGDSVARMLGSANGKIGLYMNGGHVSELVMQAAAIDLWGLAKVAARGDEEIPIRCVVGDFGVKSGVMETNALVFDTKVVNVGGSGRIDLKNEQLDLTLFPEPKDRSIASLNSPLYIRGPFTGPKVAPDWKRVATKGAGAVVMGILNPLLAVIPLVNDGPGKDSNCGQLIAETTSKTRTAAAAGERSSAQGASAPAPKR